MHFNFLIPLCVKDKFAMSTSVTNMLLEKFLLVGETHTSMPDGERFGLWVFGTTMLTLKDKDATI